MRDGSVADWLAGSNRRDVLRRGLIGSTDRSLSAEQEMLLHFQNNICGKSDYLKFHVYIHKMANCKIFQACVLS
jgi:hypothetical protein